MKLSEIVAKLTGLEARVSAADKIELEAVKAQVDGQIAKLTGELESVKLEKASAETKLTASETKLTELSATVAGLDTTLNGAIAALKIEHKADASAAEKISALETFAKVAGEKASGVDASKIPAAGVKPEGKSITRAELKTMSPADLSAHFRAGGKITE